MGNTLHGLSLVLFLGPSRVTTANLFPPLNSDGFHVNLYTPRLQGVPPLTIHTYGIGQHLIFCIVEVGATREAGWNGSFQMQPSGQR